jgi:hypothetical protein
MGVPLRSRLIPSKAGIASSEWPVAAGWLDYDNDGRLDLFVNYLRVR